MRSRSALAALRVGLLSALAIASTFSGRASAVGIEDIVDGGNSYAWQRVELPNTFCSNGSQYRFW